MLFYNILINRMKGFVASLHQQAYSSDNLQNIFNVIF